MQGEEKMLNELMGNPVAWILLSLCTIFSVIFAIYTWIVGNRRKEISVDYSSNDIIKQGKQPIPKLDIKFEDKIIQDLSSTIFYIWNSGNDIINIQDIVTTKGLKIRGDKNQILDAQVIKQSDESNAFIVSKCTSEAVEIEFDYIDSGEGVKLQVLHTGSGNELFVECKIKGGKAIRNCQNLKKHKGVKGFIITTLHELAPMVFLFLGLILSAFILQILGISDTESGSIVLSLAFIIAIVLMIIYAIIYKKIKKVFNRIVPQNIKE